MTKKIHYIIYKTTNKINGREYIGQHKTKNINDGYMGSGKIIRQAISKYGAENFTKEILFDFDNFEDMNNKEIEMINKEYIKKDDTYNISQGGNKFNRIGLVTARRKGEIEYTTMAVEKYDPEFYETPSSGKLLIMIGDMPTYIKSSDYNPLIHKTPSTGYTTVFDKESGKNKRIFVNEYDPNKHKHLFGGIVVIDEDGNKKYVTKEEFETGKYKHIYKDMVTAINIKTGETKHISKKEFCDHPDLYRHFTKGFVTGRHKISGEKKRFKTEDITEEIKKEYNFSTKGQVTVKDKDGKCFNAHKDDPRLLSGELVAANKDAMTGKIFIKNEKTHKNKAIKKEELSFWLSKNEGWKKGKINKRRAK